MTIETLTPVFPPEGQNPPPHFGGTAEQRAVNEATHRYFAGEDPRCMNCDCRPWGRWSGWACDAARPDSEQGTLDCLDDHPDAETPCKGPVMYRASLTASGMSFPRCDAHWDIRLETQHKINEAYPDSPIAPSWFDSTVAGESWDEDPAYF